MTTEITDNLTLYLEEVQKGIKREDFKESKLLKPIALEIVEMVDEVVPKLNWNLVKSGHMEEFWTYAHKSNMSSLEIVYTGFVGEGMSAPDDSYVFWEFGQKHEGGYNDILDRDYAYYIEYGIDKYAPNSDVKAPKRQPELYLTGAVMKIDETIIEYYAQEWIDLVLSKVA